MDSFSLTLRVIDALHSNEPDVFLPVIWANETHVFADPSASNFFSDSRLAARLKPFRWLAPQRTGGVRCER